MDFHVERGLRLHTEPKHKNLYSWAIIEIDAQGRQIGRDQIPWTWTLYFTATSCQLNDSIEIESQFRNEEATPPKVTERQVIRLQLTPGDPRDERGHTRQPTYSMFGTDRIIKSFHLEIHPLADPAQREACTSWGGVSYTAEIDFRNETQDDCIVFYLLVKPVTFARYAAKIANNSVNEVVLRVESVAASIRIGARGFPPAASRC